MDGRVDGWRFVPCVNGWLGMAWIRPRLVEFIACNLHNSISVGSSEMLIARKKKVALQGPREKTRPAHLGTVCGCSSGT